MEGLLGRRMRAQYYNIYTLTSAYMHVLDVTYNERVLQYQVCMYRYKAHMTTCTSIM